MSLKFFAACRRHACFPFKKARILPFIKSNSLLSALIAGAVNDGARAADGKAVVGEEMIFKIGEETAIDANGFIAGGALHVEVIVVTAGVAINSAFSYIINKTRDGTVRNESVEATVDRRF